MFVDLFLKQTVKNLQYQLLTILTLINKVKYNEFCSNNNTSKSVYESEIHLIPLLTVSPIAHDNTEKSQTTSTWGSKTTSTVGHPLDGSTKTGSAPTPSTFSKSAPLLFYTTLALISVFVISFLIYIFSYLRKFVISKREIKTSDLQIKNTGNSLYECVDFRHHM